MIEILICFPIFFSFNLNFKDRNRNNGLVVGGGVQQSTSATSLPLVRSNNLINNPNAGIRPPVNSSLVGQYNPRNNNNNNVNSAQSSLMGGGPPGIIPNPSNVIRNNQNQQQNNIYSKSNIQNGQHNSIMGKRPPGPGMINSNPNLSATNPNGLLPMNHRQPVNNSSGPGLLNNPTRMPMQNQYYNNNTATSNPQMNMMMNHRPNPGGLVNPTTPNAPNPNLQQQYNYMMQQPNQPSQQPPVSQMNGLSPYAQQQSQQNPGIPQPQQQQPYGQPYGQQAQGMMPAQVQPQPPQPVMTQQHPSQLANTQPNLMPTHLSHLQDPYSSYRNVEMAGHLSGHNTHPHYPIAHHHQMQAGPPGANSLKMNDLEFQEALEKNRIVSSTAISRAVQDASMGQYASAIETLVTAVSLIKQSKIAHDDRCKIFVSSLLDTKKGIEDKYYGGGGSVTSRPVGMVISSGSNMMPVSHSDGRDSRDRDR